MRLDFRVDWGYQLLYSRRHYHPVLPWDGHITCTHGAIRSVALLHYPVLWWGPCQSATETPLPGCAWKSETRRGLAGIHIHADCELNSEFALDTLQGRFTFRAETLMRDGRIVFPVGWKYGHCSVIVTRDGHYWFRPPPKTGERVFDAEQLKGGELREWSRMRQRWIPPGERVTWDADLTLDDTGVDETTACFWRWHIQAMTAAEGTEGEAQARDYMPIALTRKDCELDAFRHYLRWHDRGVQVLHDIWRDIPFERLPAGRHTLRIENRHTKLPLLIHRVTLRPVFRRHLEVCAPRWTRVGDTVFLRIRTLSETTPLRIEADPAIFAALDPLDPTVPAGEHRIRFKAQRAARHVFFQVTDAATHHSTRIGIESVYLLPPEAPDVKVGFDMTTVPHDDCGDMDWILDYTHRTQMGNLVVFRPFTPGPIPDDWLRRWGRLCRDRSIHVQAVAGYESGALPEAAGEYFQGMGGHELSFSTYAVDPDNQSGDMREAAERYMAFIRAEVERSRRPELKISFGDAGGGHRYSLLAGADFLRAETMVAHTQQHLSQARPAAQALSQDGWGVHIAIQHCKQPYLMSHCSQYYLSLAQAWMMGASFLYEEDSLCLLFKEERQTWDDALTRGKRELTRAFFRFAQTHPRREAPDVRIAALLGRYAAPFNGFICGTEQDPAYAVWGKFGRSEPAWGHRQPEKAMQLLDVLMPGASTQPLRQRYDRRRFFFSGSPFGDFDQPPIEASPGFLDRYTLCMLLGWNTLIPEDYAKLRDWVQRGGTLLLGVPQLSTHTGRDFLETMDTLALFREGDVRALCGLRILGRGNRYSGQWSAVGPEFADVASPPLSRVPSVCPDEDGPCDLAGLALESAQPVIVDAISGAPLLARHDLGKGRVYLIAAWAYPGHEQLADFCGAVISDLSRRHQGFPRNKDTSGDVFWNRRWASDRVATLMALNTDWTEPGNVKAVTLHTPAGDCPAILREGALSIIPCLPFVTLVPETPDPHVEVLACEDHEAQLRIHASALAVFRLHPADGIDAWRCHHAQNTRLKLEGGRMEVPCDLQPYCDILLRRR